VKTHDHRLVSPVPVQEQKRYEVRSWPDMPREPRLSDWRREIETRLPPDGNPRTRSLAREMFEAAGSDPQRYAQNVLSMLASEAFYYTLRPPLLDSGDPMDQFLFGTRRGFCEHYSAAFAWLMRAVGVPARVVAGYQGGEVNPLNDTVIVHQFDAHAWNEIWVSGRGWVRIDPTAAISPTRVESGLEQALAEEGSFLADSPLSPLRFRNVSWLNSLRLQVDAINYSWQLFVLQYDAATQRTLVEDWLGGVSKPRLVTAVVVVWCLLLVPPVLLLVWRRRGPSPDPVTRAYLQFCDKLGRAGLPRLPQEAPGAYARRVSIERPEFAPEVEAITHSFEELAYRGLSRDAGLKNLQRKVRAFRIPGQTRQFRPAGLESPG
jgi:transglutaminase-like putative cysteine protease